MWVFGLAGCRELCLVARTELKCCSVCCGEYKRFLLFAIVFGAEFATTKRTARFHYGCVRLCCARLRSRNCR